MHRSGKGTQQKRDREAAKAEWREEKLRRKQERLFAKEN
jgi:hypothetical protein